MDCLYDENKYTNEIDSYLYDVKENMDVNKVEIQDMSKYNQISENGDVIDDNHQPLVILKLTVRQSIHSLHEQNENINSKDLNPIVDQNLINPSFINERASSTNLILPQFIQQSSNSFQQSWSSRIYSPKLIDCNLSIFWSLIILSSKLITKGFNLSKKILRYNSILFICCYVLGSIFSINAYFFIDFLLILICIISILLVTYENWLYYYININELTNSKFDKQYLRRIEIIAYGFLIGTILTFIA